MGSSGNALKRGRIFLESSFVLKTEYSKIPDVRSYRESHCARQSLRFVIDKASFSYSVP